MVPEDVEDSSHGVVTVVLVLNVMVVTNDELDGLLQVCIDSVGVDEISVSDVSHGVEVGYGPYSNVVVEIKLFPVGLRE